MRVEIRLANQADFDQVGKIFAEENQFHADLVPEVIQTADPIMPPEWFDDVLGNPRKTLFVAQIDKELVGLVLVELKTNIDDPIFKPRKYMYISEIAVAASHRGLGIGRSLMENAHQWAQNQGITEIELRVWERNHQAIAFYQVLGYWMWQHTMRLTIDPQNSNG